MSRQGTARHNQTAPPPRRVSEMRRPMRQRRAAGKPRPTRGQVGCHTWKPRHGAGRGLVLVLSAAGAGQRARFAVDSAVCEAFSKSSTYPGGSSTQGDTPSRGRHSPAAGSLGAERCRPGGLQQTGARAGGRGPPVQKEGQELWPDLGQPWRLQGTREGGSIRASKSLGRGPAPPESQRRIGAPEAGGPRIKDIFPQTGVKNEGVLAQG